MKNSFRSVYRILLLAAFAAFLNLPLRAQSPATLTDADKVEGFFKNSGVEYINRSGAWLVKRQTTVYFFGVNEGILVGGVILAKKANIRMTAESLSEMPRINHKLDFLKVVIDDDGDVGLRFDARIRLLDQKEFNLLLDQLFAGSTTATKTLQPYLIN